jgi:hypothetical protein
LMPLATFLHQASEGLDPTGTRGENLITQSVALRHDLPRPYHAPLLGSGRIDGYDEWRALMGGAIKIGRLSGIDVKVHRTFFAFIGYRASGSLAGALPVTENGGLVGMLTIEDFGHSRLLS